jgi:hypothetical protein
MIKTYEKWIMSSLDKKEKFVIEANWKPDDPKTNEGKVFKFTFGNKVAYIDRNDLNQILFTMGDPQSQRKLIPQTIINKKWYETVLGITAQKNIKKGEEIVVKVKIDLPSTEEQIIGEIKNLSRKGIKRFADGTPLIAK